MPYDFTKLPGEQATDSALQAGVNQRGDSASSSSWPLILLSGAILVLGIILVPKLMARSREEPRREAEPQERPWWHKLQ